MGKTKKVWEVLYTDEKAGPGPAGDCSFIKRFSSEDYAREFAAGRTYFASAAEATVVEVSEATARRWGCC